MLIDYEKAKSVSHCSHESIITLPAYKGCTIEFTSSFDFDSNTLHVSLTADCLGSELFYSQGGQGEAEYNKNYCTMFNLIKGDIDRKLRDKGLLKCK